MRIPHRCISLVATIALSIASLAACGGSSSSEIVARVDGVGTISKDLLEHWIPVEAVVTYQEHPQKPVPKGLIPDPPRYADCIAYLRTTPQKLVESAPKPSTLDLKRKCATKYSELKTLTLNTLIGWYWTIGAGLKLGLKVSDEEARQWLRRVNRTHYPRRAEFEKYLELTKETDADMLLRSKVQLFEVKLTKQRVTLEKQVPKGLSARQQKQTASLKFIQAMPPSKMWAARTSCSKGYVVSACREYKGSEAPGYPN